MSDVFVDALRYPFADRVRVDGTAMYLVTLLVDGMFFRLAARLWPDLAFLAPVLAVVVPLAAFLSLVGGVPVGDGFPPLATTEMSKLAGRVVSVAPVYLLPATVTVVTAGYMAATGSIPVTLTGATMATFATIVPLVMVACTHLSPTAAAVSVHEGSRAGLRRGALRGAVSGTCFFTWAGAAVLAILAWSTLAATASRSVATPLALDWCAYAHAAAAALVAEGVGRTTPW